MASFTKVLPRQPNAPTLDSLGKPAHRSATEDLRKPMAANPIQVLVVEDETIVRLHMVGDLEQAGFLVIEARNADEAILILEQCPHINAVFSDIQMPGSMDGIGLANLIDKRWPEKGIVVTSGAGGLMSDKLPLGSRYVAKPYEPRQVVAAITAMVNER
jgi:two-component system, response regulator PdtaR